jgi:hypothetical protein
VIEEDDGLEGNAEETTHMFMCSHQTTGKSHYQVANKASENVALFRYLGSVSNKSQLH